jgi:hypothetical protein
LPCVSVIFRSIRYQEESDHRFCLFLVPQPCLRFLRYTLQTLFSIHGETKLNMILPPGLDPDQVHGPVVKSDWPERLRRLWRMPTTARTTAEMPSMSDPSVKADQASSE